MRLVHYYPRAIVGDGGVTTSMRGWVNAVGNLSVDVAVLCAEGAGPRQVDWIGSSEVLPIPHDGSGLRYRPRHLASHLRAGDVLVLHSGWTPHNVAAARAAQRANTPYVVVPHGAYDNNVLQRRRSIKRAWTPLETRMLGQALAIQVFFPEEIADVARMAPKARFIVAPTGCRIPERSWVGGGGYLAWLGRYDVHNKGLDALLEAIKHFPAPERPRVRLRGRDSRNTLGEVRGMVRRLGLSDWVHAGGPIDGREKEEFLLAADGYVHPSRWESQGLAIVESLSLGVPSLVSRSTKIAGELARHEAALISSSHPEHFAHGIEELRKVGRGLGPRGREFVATRLAWPRVAESYLEQLRALLPSQCAGADDRA